MELHTVGIIVDTRRQVPLTSTPTLLPDAKTNDGKDEFSRFFVEFSM